MGFACGKARIPGSGGAGTTGAGSGGAAPDGGDADAGVDVTVDGCAPGSTAKGHGECQSAGVPPGACAKGFKADGADGCTPILPAAACPDGSMAVPGDTACRAVMPCGAAPWGDIPVEKGTQYVDGSFAGTSDGSATAPWKKVQDAIDAAADGGQIAITDGTYKEDLEVLYKSVRMWGRCPSKVTLSGSVRARTWRALPWSSATPTRVKCTASASRGLAHGVVVQDSANVLLDKLWVHDLGWTGVEADLIPGGVFSNIHLVDSLVERATEAGVLLLSGGANIERSLVRDTVVSGSGRAIQAHLPERFSRPRPLSSRGSPRA